MSGPPVEAASVCTPRPRSPSPRCSWLQSRVLGPGPPLLTRGGLGWRLLVTQPLPHQLLEAPEPPDEQSEPGAKRHPHHGLLHSGEPQRGEGTGTPKPCPRPLETPDPLQELTAFHFSFRSPLLLQPLEAPCA